MPILAKSNGQPLASHLRATSKVAAYLATRLGVGPDLVESARLAGLLHDIGKAAPSFQAILSGAPVEGLDVVDDQAGEAFTGPYHHELSWAVLRGCDFTPGKPASRDLVLNAVYWHHSRPIGEDFKYREDVASIIPKPKSPDILAIIKFLKVDLGVGRFPTKWGSTDARVPSLYDKDALGISDTNARLMLVRGCTIAADRYVSSISIAEADAICACVLDVVTPAVEAAFSTVISGDCTYTIPAGYDVARFAEQDKCACDCAGSTAHRTAVAAAPAGFGKTTIGVLHTAKRGQRSFWVCPRNAVAEAVYDNICREVQALGLNLSIELFLAGERQACTTGSPEEGFMADIIVTNIDNFTKPMVGNDVAQRLFQVMCSDVVMDEFHEFVGDEPLFAAFVHLMRLRHQVSRTSRTLLLSATPSNISELWDTRKDRTLHLPSRGHHYSPAHARKYSVSISGNKPVSIPAGHVLISNSVKNAQEYYRSGVADRLVHSYFYPADRKAIMSGVFAAFGKSAPVPSTLRVSSAPVLQAAMDISFQGLAESVLSPESTLQRLGRCNRWGTQPDGAPLTIYVAPDSDRSEVGAVRAMADYGIRNLWISHVKSAIGTAAKMVDLVSLYKIYNGFYTKHGQEVLLYLKSCLIAGSAKLSEINPVKPPMSATKAKNGSSSKSLRTPGGSFSFIVKDNTGTWGGPEEMFSATFHDISKYVSEQRYSNRDWDILLNSEGVADNHVGYTRLARDLRRGKRVSPLSEKLQVSLARSSATPYPVGLFTYRREPDPVKRNSGDAGLGLVRSALGAGAKDSPGTEQDFIV